MRVREEKLCEWWEQVNSFQGHKACKEECLRRDMRSSLESSTKSSMLFHWVRICHLPTIFYNSRSATVHCLWDDPLITNTHFHLAASCGFKFSTLVSIDNIISDYVNTAFYKISHRWKSVFYLVCSDRKWIYSLWHNHAYRILKRTEIFFMCMLS